MSPRKKKPCFCTLSRRQGFEAWREENFASHKATLREGICVCAVPVCVCVYGGETSGMGRAGGEYRRKGKGAEGGFALDLWPLPLLLLRSVWKSPPWAQVVQSPVG